ncbi:hypothetical protein ABE354_10520 [Brevibacillus laterosporus]|uniref:hypothetical protein n=1 Tax=Brevibacillus laterosporus TaxID=1465 RepID=UPI003D2045BA
MSRDGNNAHLGECSDIGNKLIGYIKDEKAMDLPLINDGVLVGYVGKYGPYIPEKLTYLDRINYTNDVLERIMGGPLVPGGGGLKLVSAAKAGTQKVVQGLSES